MLERRRRREWRDAQDVGVGLLTPRQTEILALVAAGYRNREIGSALGVDEETVKSHIRKTLYRLGARNRAHAVALWLKSEFENPQQEVGDGS